MLPVVNTYNETTANKVVTVVKIERTRVSESDWFKIGVKDFTSFM